VIVPFLRNSPLLRALVLTTGVFSFLTWLYVVTRIVVNGVDPHDAFFPRSLPFSFGALGEFTFGLSFVSMFLYAWLWGRFGRGPDASGR
jgi:hypothetical protein